jgi:hypothetical protein
MRNPISINTSRYHCTTSVPADRIFPKTEVGRWLIRSDSKLRDEFMSHQVRGHNNQQPACQQAFRRTRVPPECDAADAPELQGLISKDAKLLIPLGKPRRLGFKYRAVHSRTFLNISPFPS